MNNEYKVVFNHLDNLYKQHENEYQGAALRVLRSEFANYTGSHFCIGLNSGLDALTMAIRSLGIGPGDEVIVQANTYIATVLAITANRAAPIFVEPDEYHGIDRERIEKAITPRTKAIMAVHLYGQPCDMGAISEISQRVGIPIVEDCAQSHGATFQGKMTGTFGVLGCFSFYPTKNLGAFRDAGAVVTDDPALADKIKILRNYGSRVKYHNEIEGVNSRLDEQILSEREEIVRRYLEGITNPLIKLPKVRPGSRHTWHQFVIQCHERDRLQAHLKETSPPFRSLCLFGFPQGFLPDNGKVGEECAEPARL